MLWTFCWGFIAPQANQNRRKKTRNEEENHHLRKSWNYADKVFLFTGKRTPAELHQPILAFFFQNQGIPLGIYPKIAFAGVAYPSEKIRQKILNVKLRSWLFISLSLSYIYKGGRSLDLTLKTSPSGKSLNSTELTSYIRYIHLILIRNWYRKLINTFTKFT